MNSKNKPPMTAEERAYVDLVKQMDCIVCGAPGPSDAHEPEQGLWHCAIPCCRACHGGPGYPDGWHGTRQRWQLRKMDMLQAIANTVRAVFRIVLSMPLQTSSRRLVAKEPRPSKLTRPGKIVARRITQ